MNNPQFNLSDIQIAVGDHEFQKAFELYQKGKVKRITKDFRGYTAIVSGTHDYNVEIDANHFDRGNCNCYVGNKDELCKHMLALAIALVYKFRPEDTKLIDKPLDRAVCSGQMRDIQREELTLIKSELSDAFTYIKSYSGPSSKWFKYQDDLTIGSRKILLALSKLPVCKDSVSVCIDIFKRIERKVLRGVDDSDGTIGNLLFNILELLNLFISFDSTLRDFIKSKKLKSDIFDIEKEFHF